MDILNLLNHQSTNLPIIQSNSEDFRSLIKRLFEDFLKELEKVDDFSNSINNNDLDITVYKTKIKTICAGIVETIDYYYSGKPSNAYKKLSETLKAAEVRTFLDKDLFIENSTNFYRLRKHTGNFPLNRMQLFHIPFEQRGKVKTQRYSIPGLPSLYISNSSYVAWEEMGRPSFDSIQAIRLINNRQLNLLDLTSDCYNNEFELTSDCHGWDYLYKVIIWPLVASCSIKVKNQDDIFKPEYIIPQLLLQWINKEKLDGIKYSSTHIDLKNQNNKGHFYNIVLPVKTFNKEYGFCTQLKALFSSTEVLPMQLRQFASHSDKFNTNTSISSDVNIDIRTIGLVNGTSQPYSQTYFGILEHSLKSLEMSPLA